jgi:hypothetical protein
LRAALEMVLVIGLGTAYYVSDPLANETNYDDPSLLEKLSGGAWCFDTNLFPTNFILHPLAGATSYGLSRVNGLGVLPAFTFSLASSTIWESAFEWREQVSVNDLLVTPLAGAALGEFLFRLGHYVNSAPADARLGNGLAKYTLGLPQALHDALDRQPGTRSTLPPDSLGFSSAYWHDFSLSLSFGWMENDAGRAGTGAALGAGARLVALPGYRRLGRFATFFDEGNFTEGALRVLLDREQIREVDLRVGAILFGHYAQFEAVDHGLGMLFGLRSGLRYYDSSRLGRRDTFAAAELPGPAAGLWARAGSFRVELNASVHLDFAGIRAAAYPRWQARHGARGVKAILAQRSYAYYGCVSGLTELTMEYGALQTGAVARLSGCRSIQGLDRFEGHVPNEATSKEHIRELGFWTRFPRGAHVQAGFQVEQRWHGGTMGNLDAELDDSWVSANVSYVF